MARSPDWKFQWTIGALTTIAIGIVAWMASRIGDIQKELSGVSERVARIETTTTNISKQLDAIQPARFAIAAKDIELASRDVLKAASIAADAANALRREQQERQKTTPPPPPKQ